MEETAQPAPSLTGPVEHRLNRLMSEEILTDILGGFMIICGPQSQVAVPRGLDPGSEAMFVKAVHAVGAVAISAKSMTLRTLPPKSTRLFSDTMHDAGLYVVVLSQRGQAFHFKINIDYKYEADPGVVDDGFSWGPTTMKIVSGLERVVAAPSGPEAALTARASRINASMQTSATSLTRAAARVAGPDFPWALEAWRADLQHGPAGRHRRFPAHKKLLFASGLLLFTAPRLRMSSTWSHWGKLCNRVGAWGVKTFDSWLASDAAVIIANGSALTWLGWTSYQSAAMTGGFNAGVTAATTTIAITGTAAFEGVRWLRRRRSPGAEEDK